MRLPSILVRSLPVVSVAAGSATAAVLFPQLLFASGGGEGSAQFFVAAWLVRVWLGLASGATIIIGVMLALDSYSPQHISEPVLTEESRIKIDRKYRLSYRKIGGGLLCVVFGCALLVSTVFLLPDKRTGHSGIGKIMARFEIGQVIDHQSVDIGGHAAADRQHEEVRKQR
ncbi:MAG: hypothetical protein L3J03_02895 [Desulfobacterales bacterium]|nr:hypothetical protein [Desulfobacterales bacterium]